MKLTYYSTFWCGPCKQFAPVVEQFCSDNGIEFVKLDLEEVKDDLILPLIKSVPFLKFEKGLVTKTTCGTMSISELKKFCDIQT